MTVWSCYQKEPLLLEVERKLLRGHRLQLEEGLVCLGTRDLIGLGRLALRVKRMRFGRRVFYVVNHHLNYTNLCANGCAFCAFHRPLGSPQGYVMTPQEAALRVAASAGNGLREVHVVGGCNPELPFDYYRELVRALKGVKPGLRVKAFTAV